jgi:hypothetical protein
MCWLQSWVTRICRLRAFPPPCGEGRTPERSEGGRGGVFEHEPHPARARLRLRAIHPPHKGEGDLSHARTGTDSIVTNHLANAPPPGGFVFGRPGCPYPCFPCPLQTRGWSAGRRPGACATGSLRQALRSARLCVLRDARAPFGALRLPTLHRDAVVGHRTSLRHPTPLKTTPSMSKAAEIINAVFRAGISLGKKVAAPTP